MNHIYRVIFNRHTNTFQAVAETAKSQGKTHSQKSSNSSTTVSKLVLRPLSVVIGLLVGSVAVAAPTGGEVVAGVANIHQAGNITNINQSTQNAAINWQQFGIKAHETVNFNQPNVNAVTLNRVIGNEKSVIDGAMNANGKVFIQNANGTLIGKNAQINVGGLVATTAKISDEDFMSGNYRFTGATGSIENLGDIKVPKGGVVALIAPIVKNSGTITAHGADTLLASAESFSITLPNDGQFSYTLDKGTLQGLVDNGGAILADGGRVVLTTKGIDTVKKSIIKHSGFIEANTIKNNNGVIELLGDLDNSELHLTGSLTAEGKGTDDGGFIETSAAKLNIDDKAHISTQAEQGKTGTWLIDPKDFTVAPTGGDTTGAKVSQGLQNNNVQLKSREGAIEGKGDVIINDEINWDKNKLTLTADNDIHINKTLNGTGTASLALEYGQATVNGTVKVTKDGETEWQDNDYYLQKDTPLASRTVKVNLPVGKNFSTKKGRNGEVEIYDVIHEMPDIHPDGTTDKFISNNIAIGRDIDLSKIINSNFLGWKLPKEDFVTILGLGHTITNLNIKYNKAINDKMWESSIVMYKKHIPIGLFRQANFKTLRDIGINNSNISISVSSKEGDFTSSGHLNVGLLVGESSIKNGKNISIKNSSVKVSNKSPDFKVNTHIGLLSGFGTFSSIDNVYANGHVYSESKGFANVGGVFGSSSGEWRNIYSDANISNNWLRDESEYLNHQSPTGGLVGYHTGRLDRGSFTGSVTGNYNVGGLVGILSGFDDSSITNSTTNAFIKGKNRIGGIAGQISGRGKWSAGIYRSYANSKVTGDKNVGGIVGSMYSSGLAGFSFIQDSYSNSQIDGNENVGGIVGIAEGSTDSSNIRSSYSNSVIRNEEGIKSLGGLIGYNTKHREHPDSARISNSYFKKSFQIVKNIGNNNDLDLGKTEAELKQKATFKDWDFNKVWRISEGSDMPRLRALTQGTIIITPTLPTNPTPPTTPKTDLGIQAHNLNKTYDGKAVNTEDDLRAIATDKNNGFKDIVEVIGLKDGDQLSTLGKLTYGGSWKGAKNAGKYSILPSGLNGGQKYEIKYEGGSLTIDPKYLEIQAIKHEKVYDGNNSSYKKPILIGELVDGDSIVVSQYFESKEPKPRYYSILIPKYIIKDGNNGENYKVDLKNSQGTIIGLEDSKNLDLDSLKSVNDFYDWEAGLHKNPINIRFNDKGLPIIKLKNFSNDDLKKLNLVELREVVASIHRYNKYNRLPDNEWHKYRKLQNSLMTSEQMEVDFRIGNDSILGGFLNALEYTGKGIVSKEGFIFLSKITTLSVDTALSIYTAGKVDNVLTRMSEHPAYDTVKRLIEETSGLMDKSYNHVNSARNYFFGTAKLTLATASGELKEGSWDLNFNKKVGASLDVIEAATKLAIYASENPQAGLSKDDALAIGTFLTDVNKALISIPEVKQALANSPALGAAIGSVNTVIDYGNALNEGSKAGSRYGEYIGGLLDKDVKTISDKYRDLTNKLQIMELRDAIKHNQNLNK